MNKKFQDFLGLHQQADPLVIANAWDVESARIFAKANYKAVATSSAAVATSLGYSDGETMPFEEYKYIVSRIAPSIDIPLSVDIEGGYGDTPGKIAANIKALTDLGVVGVNLEDSKVVDGKRSIRDSKEFSNVLRAVVTQLQKDGADVFINVRADSYVLGLPNALEDALMRIELYQETGVHGIFLPLINDAEQITKVTRASKLPVNVMCIPSLPDFSTLKKAGIKRISMGPFAKNFAYTSLQTVAGRILAEGSFKSLF